MCNIGTIDRILRAIIGLVILTWGVIEVNYWGAVGVVLLATSAISFCPIYTILKLNTGCKKD